MAALSLHCPPVLHTMSVSAELECGICLTLPLGEVHQCHEGHCYCVDCWNRLDPRRCPECRQPVPEANRCRAAERAIAALEASCDHCGEVMTRGLTAAHMHVCPQRPTPCAAGAVGCGWSGLVAEQAAHEAACPFAICLRVIEPLQAQHQLLQAQCDRLQVHNQQLQQQVVALLPLASRMRALEGDAEATVWGGQRQRQRLGPAPHAAPSHECRLDWRVVHLEPSPQMGLAEAVATLRAQVAVAQVAEAACRRVADLCLEEGNRQPAADAGVLVATVAAMQAHPQAVGVQEYGCQALSNVCWGSDAAGLVRKWCAAEAGVLEAVTAAMHAHPQAAGVQEMGCAVLHSVSWGSDAAALARRQRAAEAGAFEAVVAAMQAHPQLAGVQMQGCIALSNVSYGDDIAAPARRQHAVEAGGRGAAAVALWAHPGDAEVQRMGQYVGQLLADRVQWFE